MRCRRAFLLGLYGLRILLPKARNILLCTERNIFARDTVSKASHISRVMQHGENFQRVRALYPV